MAYVKADVRVYRLLPGLLAVSAFAGDAALDALLKGVETRYNHAKTLQVLFQEDYTPPARPKQTESGTLMLRKPGCMRWDYNQPKGKLSSRRQIPLDLHSRRKHGREDEAQGERRHARAARLPAR